MVMWRIDVMLIWYCMNNLGFMYLLAVEACAKGMQWERALSLMVERRSMVKREEEEMKGKT